MKKVFVSGCYDILHAGHIQFFKDAKALGDHLTVCFASKEVLRLSKNREPALPDEHKKIIIESIKCVDKAVSSSDLDAVLDFATHLKNERPDILVVTEDDKNVEIKKKLCGELGIEYIILPKRTTVVPVSTTDIRAQIKEIIELPLRIDFAGGWLDVPKYSVKGGYIVNCTITPKVSLKNWPYNKGAGLGGFQLNIQELETVKHNQLPVKMVVLNNQSYGMVRQFQESYFDNRFQSTVWGYSAPSFSKIGNAYGIESKTIRNPEEIESALSWLSSDLKKPALLEIMIDLSTNVFPKLAFGKKFGDMEPQVKPVDM